jgi:hypothetical protein
MRTPHARNAVDKISEVGSAQVALDGSTVDIGSARHVVPDQARPLLIAQLIFRELACFDTDRFLVNGAKEAEITGKWAGRLLTVITRDTGVVLRGSYSSRRDVRNSRWNHRLGLSVEDIRS